MIALILTLAALAGPPEVGLDEAVRLATSGNVENRVAALEVDAARARANQVRSYYLPSLSASYSALWWDGPLEAQLFEGDPCAEVDPPFDEICSDLISGFLDEPLLLRDAHTRQAQVQVTQPLTGLYGISQGHRATRAMVRASEADLQATRSRVSLDVVHTWLQAAKTTHLVQVAADGVATLEAHERRAEAFREQGLVGKNEVLQLQVALSGARLDLRRAEVGVDLLQRKLAFVTGAEAEALAPVPLEIAALPPVEISAAELSEAVGRKPAVQVLEAQADAAVADRNRARAELVPQVAGIAQWTRHWGVGNLAADQEAFVGLGLQWDVWSWGRNHYAAQEAMVRARQARAGLEGLERGAALEAASALHDADIAAAAWASAQVTLDQAEENLRIVTARYEAHTLTTTDLLEAETLAAKARADHVGAGYDYLIAVARLQDALGLPVDPLAGVPR